MANNVIIITQLQVLHFMELTMLWIDTPVQPVSSYK